MRQMRRRFLWPEPWRLMNILPWSVLRLRGSTECMMRSSTIISYLGQARCYLTESHKNRLITGVAPGSIVS